MLCLIEYVVLSVAELTSRWNYCCWHEILLLDADRVCWVISTWILLWTRKNVVEILKCLKWLLGSWKCEEHRFLSMWPLLSCRIFRMSINKHNKFRCCWLKKLVLTIRSFSYLWICLCNWTFYLFLFTEFSKTVNMPCIAAKFILHLSSEKHYFLDKNILLSFYFARAYQV